MTTSTIPRRGMFLVTLAGILSASVTVGQHPARAQAPKAEGPARTKADVAKTPPRTFADVPYGDHPRQALDFWKADAEEPTPAVVFIHGGSWIRGEKSPVNAIGLGKLLASGISVASINYRFVPQAQEAGIKPPVRWPLEDAARAVQFLRSKAAEWNIDKARIGASGGSAGACSSLWLAFHDDLARPEDPDPIARESTWLACAAVISAQTSLDPHQTRAWMPNMGYGGHAFGFATAGRVRVRVRARCQPRSRRSTTTATRSSPGSGSIPPTSTPAPAIPRSSSTIRPRRGPPASASPSATRPTRPSRD